MLDALYTSAYLFTCSLAHSLPRDTSNTRRQESVYTPSRGPLDLGRGSWILEHGSDDFRRYSGGWLGSK